MRTVTQQVIATIALVIFACTPIAGADEIAEKGRAILEANKEAVITIQLVVNQKFSFGGEASEGMEEIIEATGTVISSDGLTVVSLSETDPSAIFEAMMAGYVDMEDFSMDIDIRDVKMLIADGSEIKAEIILRDKDLDMAFIRPKEKPETPMAHVDLSQGGVVKELDQVVTIDRLGKVARRNHSVSVSRVSSVIAKPRTFYVVETLYDSIGTPAFTLEGKLIGVYFIRTIKATGSGGMFGGDDNIEYILLPSADIQEAASQVPPFK